MNNIGFHDTVLACSADFQDRTDHKLVLNPDRSKNSEPNKNEKSMKEIFYSENNSIKYLNNVGQVFLYIVTFTLFGLIGNEEKLFFQAKTILNFISLSTMYLTEVIRMRILL